MHSTLKINFFKKLLKNNYIKKKLAFLDEMMYNNR